MGKNRINGQQQVFAEHTLDDVFRRTDHIEILMPLFDFGQHDFIDVKGLINDPDLFSRLFFVVLLEIFQNTFADIVGPVIYFQHMLARVFLVITAGQQTSQQCQIQYIFSHIPFFSLPALRLMMISNARMTIKMTADKGRSSGVSPPLRASA